MQEEKIRKKIKEIEKEIRETPYHKGTERHLGRLKARRASLKQRLARKSGGGGGSGFAVKKEGDATVVLVGMPSVGKSTLLNKLTGADSEVGHYPFTTLAVIPGILKYKGARIQIFDVPGLIKGAARGKGGGKEILSVVRVADLLVLMASVKKPLTFRAIKKELEKAGVRLDKDQPEIRIEKKAKGGIEIQGQPGLKEETVKTLCREFGYLNADIAFGEKVTQEELIDILIGNRVYVDSLKVLSKADLLEKEGRKKIKKRFPRALVTSSKREQGLEKLKQTIFSKLELVRAFLRKSPSSPPQKEPLILKRGETVEEAAEKISTRFAKEIESAKVKGPSAKFPNQKVGKNHKIKDGDQIYFVKRV